MPPKPDALVPEGSGGGKKKAKKTKKTTTTASRSAAAAVGGGGVPPPLPPPKKTSGGEPMPMKNVSSKNAQKKKSAKNATKNTFVPPPNESTTNITTTKKKKGVVAEEEEEAAMSKPLSASEKLQLKEQIERDAFQLKEKIRIETERKSNEEKEKLFLKKKKELELRKQTRLKRQKLRTKNEEFDAILKENDKSKEKEMENKLRQMDSAIKKNVALVKKLKTSAITEATSVTLRSDFESKINASKYMEECVVAISRGKLKGSDAFYAAEVIHSMFGQLFQKNQRTEMKEMLKKEILAIATPMSSAEAAQMALEIGLGLGVGLGIGGDSSIGGQQGEDLNNDDDDEENKPPTPLLRRAKLCLLAELYLISIIDSPKCVYEVVKKHAEMEYDVAPEAYLQSLSALAFFAKTYSLEFLGKEDVKLISINSSEGEEKEAKTDDVNVNDDEEKNSVVKCKPEVCEKFAQIIHEKYEKDALVKLAASVRLASAREEDVLRVLKTKGEVPAQVSSAFSKATATRDALLKQCQTLAEALRVEKIPKLEDFMDDDIDDKDKNKEANRIELDRGLKQRNAAAAASENNSDVNASEWESDEQRRFYQDLLPIKESIPAVLLVEKPALENETDAEKKRREDQESKDFKVDALMNRLRRDCENAEKVDAFAVDFCYVATPGAKKRLAEELLSPPELTNMKNNNNNNNNNNAMTTENSSNQQQNALLMSPLVPFYARVLKLMSKVFPKDISDVVASKVLENFFNLNTTIQTTTTPQPRSNVHSSSQQQQQLLKQKLQNVHYVSELIKFELIDPSVEAMQCLQILIENFERVNSLNAAQNGAVELMCAFVYRCGRFLCKSAKSKKRANTFLDIILRLKSIVSKYLDETQVALVDEAYYAARPREVFRTTKPPKPVLFEYVKYIFVEQMSANPSLAKRQLAKVLKHCDQFDDVHLERYLIRRAIKHSQQKFDDAERVVRLMSKLSQNQKDIKKNELIVKFTDAALEEFRFGLEQNLSHMTQRRVSNARVIGELFSQRCLHAESIFSCLFLLLNNLEPFNNDFDRKDPIRVRVANVLLEKCGRFFNRGWQKKKLDVFLTYFQRYMRSKTLSMDVNNDAVNIIKELRPQMKICESFQEAHEKCVKMEERFGVVSSSAVEGEKKGSGGLGTLAEDEEMEEEEGDGDDTDDDDDDGESETLEDDYASSMSGDSSDDDEDEEEEESDEDDDDDDDESVSSSDDGNDSFSSSESSESSSSEEQEVEVRMKTVVASRQEESEFEREMEKFLGVGSVKVNRNDENKQQTAAIPSGPNVGKSPPPAFAAQSIAFKMMRKGKDGKREKVDIALPETASFAMEAKKRQIMEAEELSEVRRLTLQRTADMQEEAISLEKQNKEGGINSMSWRKKKSSGDADQDGESKKDSFWNAHRRL